MYKILICDTFEQTRNTMTSALVDRCELACISSEDEFQREIRAKQFDLVFLDPPYNKNLIIPALDHLRLSQSLENGARIIVEHSQLEPVEPDRPAFEMVDQRRYGKTLVSFLNYVI